MSLFDGISTIKQNSQFVRVHIRAIDYLSLEATKQNNIQDVTFFKSVHRPGAEEFGPLLEYRLGI
jgi:hypothetical protein